MVCGVDGPRCRDALNEQIASIRDGASELLDQLAGGAKKKATKKLVFLTIIPKRFMCRLDELDKIDVRKANRWFKDVIKAIGKDAAIAVDTLAKLVSDGFGEED